MPRAEWADVVIDNSGNLLNGASISVKTVDSGGTQGGDATIYVSEFGASKANPFLTGADGYANFWADTASRYNIIISGTGFTTRTIRWDNTYIPSGFVLSSMILDATIAVVDLATAVKETLIQPGFELDWPYASGTVPAGWLLEFGQAVSRTTYSALHALAQNAGYPHGSGDGSTTFNLPDARGRVSAGKDDMGGTAANRISVANQGTTLGGVHGAQSSTLTISEIPSHSHGGGVHSHGLSDPSHAHDFADIDYTFLPMTVSGGSQVSGNWLHTPQAGGTPWAYSTAGSFTGISINNSGATISPEGGGAAHNNLQPGRIVNKIIKT